MTKRSMFAAAVFSLSACILSAATPPTIVSVTIDPFVTGGTQITINGKYLATSTETPTVTVDGGVCVVTASKPTQVVALLTGLVLGTGSYRVTVTLGTLSGQFDVSNLALPFAAQDSTGPTAFTVVEQAPGALGLYAIGGPAVCGLAPPSPPCASGTGMQGIGGAAGTVAGAEGGIGIAGLAGALTEEGTVGLAGGQFEGGGISLQGTQVPVYGGPGVQAFGGASGPGGEAGDGIVGYPGPGPSDGMTYGLAGAFAGNVLVAGNVLKSGGSFIIDHPTDPEHKYLLHSFVESPDMMNIYNGNVTTNSYGVATVTLPDWFETLNRDFRYQLTVIGRQAQAWVAAKIASGQFQIKTDKPLTEVSWQVTGIRQDAWANAHRIPQEVEKPAKDQGHYLHPELYGHAGEPGVVDLHQTLPSRSKQ